MDHNFLREWITWALNPKTDGEMNIYDSLFSYKIQIL